MTDAPAVALDRDAVSILARVRDGIAAGDLVPYLGPEVLTLIADPLVPVGTRELSHRLSSRVAVSGRIRNNLWQTAQYIESHRHRVTVDKLMAEIFKPVPEPTALHHWLASLVTLPLIVDTWYDGAMARALTLAGRTDWGLVQGASKARRLVESPWTRVYDREGRECPAEAAEGWKTLLYKPHGAAQPVGDVLVSDADYVEVLTEIDIQTPIPDEVKHRRGGRGMVFLGCRFYDQILRIFARSVMRRMAGPHYAVMPAGELTRNEVKFLASEGIVPLAMPLDRAVAVLTGGTG